MHHLSVPHKEITSVGICCCDMFVGMVVGMVIGMVIGVIYVVESDSHFEQSSDQCFC